MKQISLNSVSSWWQNHQEGTVPSDLNRLMSLLWQSSQPPSHHETMNLIMRQHQTNDAVGDSLPGPPFKAHSR